MQSRRFVGFCFRGVVVRSDGLNKVMALLGQEQKSLVELISSYRAAILAAGSAPLFASRGPGMLRVQWIVGYYPTAPC